MLVQLACTYMYKAAWYACTSPFVSTLMLHSACHRHVAALHHQRHANILWHPSLQGFLQRVENYGSSGPYGPSGETPPPPPVRWGTACASVRGPS